MNKKIDLADLNVSLTGFGNAPMMREGEPVNYDLRGNTIKVTPAFEVEVELDGEEVNDGTA